MKKFAFTIIELIFIVIIIGILVAVFIPKFGQNKLAQATNQVITSIRYTQHLALMDDKYDVKDAAWFKERWNIRFKKDLVYSGKYTPTGTYSKVWSCTIYSDKSHDGNPYLNEMALNPINPQQYLSGGENNVLHHESDKSMEILRLGEKYGINQVEFGGGCRSNVMYVNFDHLGRPSNSFPLIASYEKPSAGFHKLLTKRCEISLCITPCSKATSSQKAVIAIEPETGYVHLL